MNLGLPTLPTLRDLIVDSRQIWREAQQAGDFSKSFRPRVARGSWLRKLPAYKAIGTLKTSGDVVGGWMIPGSRTQRRMGTPEAVPALVVHFLDPDEDASPLLLRDAANYVASLIDKSPREPLSATLARYLTNHSKPGTEVLNLQSLPLPPEVTDGHKVALTYVVVYPEHMPEGRTSSAGGFYPVVIAPDKTPHAILLPADLWSDELLEIAPRLDRTIEIKSPAKPTSSLSWTPEIPDEGIVFRGVRGQTAFSSTTEIVSAFLLMTLPLMVSIACGFGIASLLHSSVAGVVTFLGVAVNLCGLTWSRLLGNRLRNSITVFADRIQLGHGLVKRTIPVEEVDLIESPSVDLVDLESMKLHIKSASLDASIKMHPASVDKCAATLRAICRSAAFIDMHGKRHLVKDGNRVQSLQSEERRQLRKIGFYATGTLVSTASLVNVAEFVFSLLTEAEHLALPKYSILLAFVLPFCGYKAISSFRKWKSARAERKYLSRKQRKRSRRRPAMATRLGRQFHS